MYYTSQKSTLITLFIPFYTDKVEGFSSSEEIMVKIIKLMI